MKSIVNIIENACDGDIIELEAGRYPIDRTIHIRSKKNITIKAKGEVFFDGGITIPPQKVKTY
ncbi:MAG: hypothetical protein U0M06_08790, partial [Clostridia bacterium]|nr:hypothetical protein [Clostridia bacterium]